ncbi:o-succinylbenzoate--CoA ligase [Motilimonas pumila]|uniref:O-succinylbenzoate--CoA ligase n=1 Tax=Motilimonas pumila TaxID=2303987 RepID=A0A418YH51_9GAMM|nr:o-succinylbenzoate--CoA ligase [Motilimonas pumila]RJG49431.1 o-succinylbenzoate--CoA ligase [Motilimonas pumila]
MSTHALPSAVKPSYPSTMNVCPVAYFAQHQPLHRALQMDAQGVTYQALDQEVTALSESLYHQISQPGSPLVVAIISQDATEIVPLLFACLRLGYVLCPIAPQLPAKEILQRCLYSGIRYVIDDQATLTSQQLQQAALSKITQQRNAIKPAPAIAPPQPSTKIVPARACTAVFTSGSSGQAKAVIHSFSNHYFSAAGSQQILPFHNKHAWLLSLPLYHIAGIALVMRAMLAGGTLVISKQNFIAALQNHYVTHASLVPTQVYRLLQSRKLAGKASDSHLQHVLVGGAALPQSLLQELATQPFESYISYGLTEMSSQVATVSVASLLASDAKSYQLLPFRQVKVSQQELLLKGETLCLGYLSADGLQTCTDEAGWFHSKDLGTMHGDALTLKGRKDNMFICGGENVQPEDIEQCLVNYPGVMQAVVVAVVDPEFGQVPCALIQWQHHKQWQSLKLHCQEHLAPWQKPKYFLVLPKQAGLKPQRAQLQKYAEQQLAAPLL